MSKIYNIYCDESCHLENDGLGVMVLGAIWCPMSSARSIAQQIRALKEKHGMNRGIEIKWTKGSPSKVHFYLDLVDYFFACSDLHFRGLLVPNKNVLCHQQFNQSHDEWYYKMYFTMLKQIFYPADKYNIYLDIKDTRGGSKIRKLHDVLCSSMYDFSQNIIRKVQLVRSHEVEQVQLADLLIGAVSFLNRVPSSSSAKNDVAERIKTLSGYTLKYSTLLKEDKFNLFRWIPNEGNTNV